MTTIVNTFVTTDETTDPRAVLRHHAKTFFWAWVFLPRRNRGTIARLYAFCRFVDDVADEGGDPAVLRDLRRRVATGTEPAVADFEARGIRREWILDLIDGAYSDVEFKSVTTEDELDVYCYRVAGVVGLMMCPLLGVTSPAAWQHAVDLGCAMQLTNIARDVSEDLERGRVYVPATWGGAFGPDVTHRLLDKAEGLYQSGRLGLKYIPWRTRLSIKLARVLYRDIGTSLARQNYDPFRGRAFVSPARKFWLSLKTLIPAFGSDGGLREDLAHNVVWLRLAGGESGSGRAGPHGSVRDSVENN